MRPEFFGITRVAPQTESSARVRRASPTRKISVAAFLPITLTVTVTLHFE